METQSKFEGKGHSFHPGRLKLDISRISSVGGQYSTGIHFLEELWTLGPWRFSRLSQINPWLIWFIVGDSQALSGRLVQMAFSSLFLFLWFCSPRFHTAARGVSSEFACDLPWSVGLSLLRRFLEVPVCANWTSVTTDMDQRWLCNGFVRDLSVSWYCGKLHYPRWMLHQPRRVSCVRQLAVTAVKLHMWRVAENMLHPAWFWFFCHEDGRWSWEQHRIGSVDSWMICSSPIRQ